MQLGWLHDLHGRPEHITYSKLQVCDCHLHCMSMHSSSSGSNKSSHSSSNKASHSSRKWQCWQCCDKHHSLQCSITTSVKLECTMTSCICPALIDNLFDAGCLCRQHQQRCWYQGCCGGQRISTSMQNSKLS